MQKFLILVCAIVTFSAMAKTTNWYVDGTLYQTSSCTSGDDVTPPTVPAKRGYTFAGWLDANLVMGSWAQSGTPGPTNPVYPTFYQDGDLILRAVGTGNNLVADTYNIETGKITRRVGVKVLDGTENWSDDNGENYIYVNISGRVSGSSIYLLLTHFRNSETIKFMGTNVGWNKTTLTSLGLPDTVADFKQYLADQYAAGTPVTVYYPLLTPTEEVYTPAQ